MPITEAYLQATLEQLKATRPVTHRKMFGGAGLYVDDAFFGIIDDDMLFFKVDAASAPMYEAEGMGPWYMGGTLNDKYREVAPSVLANAATLGERIDLAVQVARTKPVKARKK